MIVMRVKPISYALPVTLSGLFVGMTASQAHAYLDAGTGSMILQVLLGGVAGIVVVGKLYWHRLLVALHIRTEEDLGDDVPRTAASHSDGRDDR